MTDSINGTDILNVSLSVLRDVINLDTNRIRSDIDELSRLPSSTDKHLALVLNLDYLYQGNIDDLDTKKQNRYRRLGPAAIEEIQAISGGINIMYAHPMGWQ